MKKVFCTFLAVLMVIALSVTAMAAAICEPEEAYAGTRVVIDGFYNDTYGECDDIGTKYLTYDNYTLSKSWTNGSGCASTRTSMRFISSLSRLCPLQRKRTSPVLSRCANGNPA